jgi:hypothetical protein
MSYFDEVWKTYLENWPLSLQSLTIPQVDIPLTLAEAQALGSNIIDYGETFGPIQDISSLREKIATGLALLDNKAFVRLGSRSPKDSWLGMKEGFKVTTQEKALQLLCDCSERVADDLRLAIYHGYAPHIFLRQWVDLPKWSELRCFMKRQYFYKEYFPELQVAPETIFGAVTDFFDKKFKHACHLDDVVFDVFVANEYYVRLLEINPFGPYTDPCLYSWKAPERFDGSFKWNKEQPTKRIPLPDLQ